MIGMCGELSNSDGPILGVLKEDLLVRPGPGFLAIHFVAG